MSTLKDEFELLKAKINAGKGNEICHVVYHSAELKRKKTNPDKSTRMMLQCRTPEQWTEMQMQKERYMAIAVDPGIGLDLMIKALAAFSEQVIRGWVKDGNEERPGPTPAEPMPGEDWFDSDLPESLR